MHINALINLIKKNAKPEMVTCEVGVFDGNTSRFYIPTIARNGGKAILVDWFQGTTDALTGYHRFQPENKRKIYETLVRTIWDYLDNVIILSGDSTKMAKFIPDRSLDICFVDADHKYTKVKMDIEAYLPKVKSGGILCGHDCEDLSLANSFTNEELELDWKSDEKLFNGGCHPGVIQAVYDLFGKDVELIPGDEINKIPVWVKRV